MSFISVLWPSSKLHKEVALTCDEVIWESENHCKCRPVWCRNEPFYGRKHMGVEPKIGGKPPKWMVYVMENPIKIHDLGVSLFLETPIWEVLCYSLPFWDSRVKRLPWKHSRKVFFIPFQGPQIIHWRNLQFYGTRLVYCKWLGWLW